MKEWFSKQLRQVLHVSPKVSNVVIEVIDLKNPDLERYMHLVKNQWSLKVTIGAYSYTLDDSRGSHWEEFFICKETESIKGNFLTINIPQYC